MITEKQEHHYRKKYPDLFRPFTSKKYPLIVVSYWAWKNKGKWCREKYIYWLVNEEKGFYNDLWSLLYFNGGQESSYDRIKTYKTFRLPNHREMQAIKSQNLQRLLMPMSSKEFKEAQTEYNLRAPGL